MQETQVQSLVREDPTCCGATKLVHHNYWACVLEPGNGRKRSHQNEKLVHSSCNLLALTREKPVQQRRPSATKNKQKTIYMCVYIKPNCSWIPTTRHSGKGKTMGTVKRQWSVGEGREGWGFKTILYDTVKTHTCHHTLVKTHSSIYNTKREWALM